MYCWNCFSDYEPVNIEDFFHCPLCGSDNLEGTEGRCNTCEESLDRFGMLPSLCPECGADRRHKDASEEAS